jgi:phosphatidylinositol alpha-mannosyltransferase
VKAQAPNARLIVVGAGRFERFERTVKSKGIADVVFQGYVPYEELPRYHQTADIFCAPNTGFESQGIVLLEAMAAGMPIVASNIEGFAAVLTHGVEGLLALPGDESSLAEALLKLVGDADRRREMGRQGSRRAQEFAWPRVSQQVLSYYERLLYEKRLAAAPPKRREPQAVGSR